MTTHAPTTFPGFPPDTLPFLRAVRDRGDPAWFAAHRNDYQRSYLEPARSLVRALADRLPELSPRLVARPTVGGSIFRIARDRRFARDLPPYKDYLDLWFWEGDRGLAPGGLYLRVTPDVVRFGVGVRRFGREALARYRRAVVDPRSGAQLAGVVAGLAAAGVTVEGRTLRRLPRDLPPAPTLPACGLWPTSGPDPTTSREGAASELDQARADLLRHTALIVDDDLPAAGLAEDGPALIEAAISRWRRGWPLHRWLVDHVQR